MALKILELVDNTQMLVHGIVRRVCSSGTGEIRDLLRYLGGGWDELIERF